jgi:O-antigen ligase
MATSAKVQDLVLAAILLGVSAVTVLGVRDVPPPIYEPLGAAFFPNALAAILAVLAAVMAWRSWREPGKDEDPADERHWGRASAGIGATFAYVVLLGTGAVGYVVLTAAYLIGLGALLSPDRVPKRLAALTVFAVALAVSTHLVFTRLLYVRLP